jgi:hypothetical protein
LKLTNYEKLSLVRIRKWEERTHGSIEKKILDGVSKPIDYIMKKIGHEKFNLFEKAIEAAVNKMMNVSTYSVDSKELLKRAHENGIMIDDLSELISVKLKKLDDCNMKHIKFHGKASAAQGAVAGIAGALAAPADLTALLFQAFHLIQEIAFCYGYDPNDMVEKHILLRIMEVVIGSSENKFKALQEIEVLKKIERDVEQNQVSQKSVAILGSKAVQEQIVTLSVGLITRMIPRAIPIPLVTMAMSAHSDHEIMEHSGEGAFMVYRKRFIERKMELEQYLKP